ncbi:hypothetical protein BD560DRAFT_429132 [Blakeslea trispora]|nr:hypothetical protein BD560DRAFT_429132 [Blakeslea trispora]
MCLYTINFILTNSLFLGNSRVLTFLAALRNDIAVIIDLPNGLDVPPHSPMLAYALVESIYQRYNDECQFLQSEELDSASGVHATRFERSCSSRDTKEWLSIDVSVSNFTKEHFRESFDKNNWFDAIELSIDLRDGYVQKCVVPNVLILLGILAYTVKTLCNFYDLKHLIRESTFIEDVLIYCNDRSFITSKSPLK